MPSVPASWPRHTAQLHVLCSPRLPGPRGSGGVTGEAGLPGNSIKAPQRSRHLSCAPSQGLRGPRPRHREGPVCTRVHGAQGGCLSGGHRRWSWASRGGRFPPHERLAGVSGTRSPGRGSLGLQGQRRSSCDQRTLGPQRGPPGPGVGTLWDGPGGQYWALGPVFLVKAAARAPQTPLPSPVLLPPRHPLPPLVFGCLPLLPRPPPPAPAARPPGSLPSPGKGRGALGGPGVVGRMGGSQDRAEDLVGSTWGPGLLPHPVRMACDSARPALGTAFARRNVHPSALLPEPWTRTGHPPVQQARLPGLALARSPVLSGQHRTLWLLLSSCPGTWGPRAPGKNQFPRPQIFTSSHWFDSVCLDTENVIPENVHAFICLLLSSVQNTFRRIMVIFDREQDRPGTLTGS